MSKILAALWAVVRFIARWTWAVIRWAGRVLTWALPPLAIYRALRKRSAARHAELLSALQQA